MNTAFIEGFSMGLLLSAMIGPVFFTLIQNSIENGFRHSAILALGILISDLLYVLISYFGISLLVQNPLIEIFLGYLGSLVLISFGISVYIRKGQIRPNSSGFPLVKAKKRTGFLKGFSMNGVNPFVMLFWISIAGIVNLKQDFESTDVVYYYGGILGTVFFIDLLKAYVAKQLRKVITPKFMIYMNRIVALVLIVFGSRLFLFAWDKHMLIE